MTKETRSPKREASVDRLAREPAPGTPRKLAKASATGSAGRMGGNTSDFGFLNSFGIRNSEFGFHDSKPLISIRRIAASLEVSLSNDLIWSTSLHLRGSSDTRS